jgi:type IV secretion system protein VirB6
MLIKGLNIYFNFCFIIIMIATFSTYIFAKLGLLLVLAVGPLFIAAGLFPATRAYAMNWLGQVLNYTILTLLIAVLNSAIIALVTQSINEFIIKNLGNFVSITANAWAMTINMTILTVIIYMFIGKVPELASALTGGNAGTSGMSALGSSMRSFSKGGTMQKIGGALPGLPGGKAVASAASSLAQNGAMSSVAALLKKGGGAK